MSRYYESHGRGHDHLLRCKDCRSISTTDKLFQSGVCPKCGSRKFIEIIGLSLWEWLKIRLGIIDFENRKEFLREFRWS